MTYAVVPSSQKQQKYPLVLAQATQLEPRKAAAAPQAWPMVQYTQGAITQMGASFRNLQYPVAIVDAKMWSKISQRGTNQLRHFSNLAALGLLKVMESMATGCKAATDKMGALVKRCVNHILSKEASAPVVRTTEQKPPFSTTLICHDPSKKRVVIQLTLSVPVSKLPLNLRLGIQAV